MIASTVGAVLLLGACSTTPAPSAPAASTPPASTVGKGVTHSPNARLVANVPLSAPFDGDDAWGTDLAFQGNYAYVGNYEGFTIHDISVPTAPKVVTRVVCPGGQNDVSVSGNLLFLSVDEPRADATCGSGPGDENSGWEGIRIFDISDMTHPRYVKSLATECGSHTHTLVPGKDPATLYLYVSSFGRSPDAAHCKPPHDSIAIVKVPVGDPASAGVVAQPVLFTDGEDDSRPGSTSGCHDITADRTLRRRGYYKIPRYQTATENCVAHNGSLLPVPGKTIMVQAWYQGGVSVIDFTDPDHPREIAYVDRGPLTTTGEPKLGGSWSAYYYNGYIYSSDITKGLDVIAVDDPLTDPAKAVKLSGLNAQTQVSYPE